MAVSTQHLEYQSNIAQWTKCRDSIAGNQAIKKAGETYLPRLTGQSKEKYAYYSSFGTFANYTARTLDALSGLIFAKDPVVKLPTQMEQWASNITKTNKSLIDFAEDIISEQLAVGRVGILVDYPSVDTEGMSQADVLARDLRPYPTIYTAESIINWRYDGKRLKFVVLVETYEAPTNDEFTYTTKTQYKVLDLFGDDERGTEYYRMRIFRDMSETNTPNYQVYAEIFPKMNGQYMTEIPFICIGVQSIGMEVQKPPLMDLVEVNLSHYRFTVDYEYGAHKTGIPTPVISGVTLDKGETIELGDTALVFDNPDAKAFFLEFEGKGMELLENLLKSKETQMAILGARMLSEDKKAAEATQTLEIRTSGERSILASMAKTASVGLTKVLQIMRDWAGLSGEIEFVLNTDYTIKEASPQYLTALMGLWQAGAITHETFYKQLQTQEIADPQESWEEYQTKLQEETPQMSVTPDTSTQSTDTGVMPAIRKALGLD